MCFEFIINSLTAKLILFIPHYKKTRLKQENIQEVACSPKGQRQRFL
jgi:hypothetical protein